MEKPYELKALGQAIVARAKEDGLELAEEAVETLAKAAYLGMKDWAKASAAMTATPIDDLGVKFTDYADGFVIAEIEKLDLNKDGK
jgi:hypothetical protein